MRILQKAAFVVRGVRDYIPGLGVCVLAFCAAVLPAQAQNAQDPVATQTVIVDGQPMSFAVPPGFCLLPQNSPYAATFYGGGAAAGAQGQAATTLTPLAAFLPCQQLREPQVQPVVAYQSWAVTTRYGSVVHLQPQDNPGDVLGAMYELTQADAYRQMENDGLAAISRSLNSALDLSRREDASGLRPSYFYRVYTVPVQGIDNIQQICAATAFAVIKGVIMRSEQLSPCQISTDKAATMQALVAEVTGQIEYFMALNAQPTPQ